MSLLIALGLVVHGLAHIGYFCNQVSFASTGPGILTNALDAGTINGVGNGLVAVTAIAYSLSALAAAGILVPGEWWRPLVVVGAIASAVVLAFSPWGYSAPGLVIDAVLLAVVLGPGWHPTPFFGR